MTRASKILFALSLMLLVLSYPACQWGETKVKSEMAKYSAEYVAGHEFDLIFAKWVFAWNWNVSQVYYSASSPSFYGSWDVRKSNDINSSRETFPPLSKKSPAIFSRAIRELKRDSHKRHKKHKNSGKSFVILMPFVARTTLKAKPLRYTPSSP